MEDFLAMGGYARFVWTAIGLTAAVLVLNVWSAARRFRKVRRDIAMRAAARDDERRQA